MHSKEEKLRHLVTKQTFLAWGDPRLYQSQTSPQVRTTHCCAVVRTSAIRRYSPLLNEEIPYYFTSTEPYYSREKPQKGEKDSESISRFFATHTCNHGNHVVHVITVPQRTPGLARFGAELVHLFLTLSIQIKTES